MLVQQLSAEQCRSALSNARFGRLACSRGDQPYIVPTYFIVEEGQIYAFALPGQKLDWMRENPRVCLEIDDVAASDDWVSVVVLGHFEELPKTLEYESLRQRAHQLLQGRPMWWEPGSVAVADRPHNQGFSPVYYRISVDQVTGHRGTASPAR